MGAMLNQGWSKAARRPIGRNTDSVCLTADVLGALKSHSARGPGLISKGRVHLTAKGMGGMERPLSQKGESPETEDIDELLERVLAIPTHEPLG